MLRAWKQWHREQLNTALDGQHGDLVARLMELLRGLTLTDGKKLVAFIDARDWSRVDPNTRLICLHEVNETITQLRLKAGMIPFDDALPGQPENIFRCIKQIIHN
jgi:hypothetical protein